MSDGPKPPRCMALTAKGTRCTKRALPGESRCAHHTFKIPGRPTKLTPELTNQVVESVLEGNYLETAAQVVGISPSTLHKWLRRADELDAQAEEHLTDLELAEGLGIYDVTPPDEWPYLDFRHALKAAEAYAETELVRLVRQPAAAPWQAYMTFLERRHPERWGRRDSRRVELTGEAARTVELVAPTDEDRAVVLERLRQAGALDVLTDDEPEAGE